MAAFSGRQTVDDGRLAAAAPPPPPPPPRLPSRAITGHRGPVSETIITGWRSVTSARHVARTAASTAPLPRAGGAPGWRCSRPLPVLVRRGTGTGRHGLDTDRSTRYGSGHGHVDGQGYADGTNTETGMDTATDTGSNIGMDSGTCADMKTMKSVYGYGRRLGHWCRHGHGYNAGPGHGKSAEGRQPSVTSLRPSAERGSHTQRGISLPRSKSTRCYPRAVRLPQALFIELPVCSLLQKASRTSSLGPRVADQKRQTVVQVNESAFVP